jgi:hypothetical protein
MTVWVQIDGDIKTKWRPVFVPNRQDAHTMSSAEAQQAVRILYDNHHGYNWEVVTAPGNDKRVIKGEEKSNKK